MDVNSIPIMAALKKRMSWLNSNQAIISQNIANADTPGYVGKELEKQNFSNLVDGLNAGSKQSVSATSMKTTNVRHIGGGAGSDGDFTVKKVKDGEESMTGNTVVLEEEMIKVADNQMEYGMVVNLYKKNMRLLKIAMGKGGVR
jgi:flagellar basal-body rod protein FlgB